MFYNDKVRNSLGEPNNSKWNLAKNKAYGYMRQELVEREEEIVDRAVRQKKSLKFKKSKYNYHPLCTY